MLTGNSALRDKLTRAFGNLKILYDKKAGLTLAIDALLLLDRHKPSNDDKLRRAFRACKTNIAAKELHEISRRAEALAGALDDPSRCVTRACEQLARRIERMHQTTIAALANVPCLKTVSRVVRINVGYVRERFPSDLRAENIDRRQLSSELRLLVQAASMSVVGGLNGAGLNSSLTNTLSFAKPRGHPTI